MDAVDLIQNAIDKGKVAGSWLVCGGFDFEKKQFIEKVCSLLLKEDISRINTFHPDVKWLECGLTEESKKEIQKNILAGKSVDDDLDLSYKREITVDDIRQGIQFLSLKSAPDKWRVLIINPADKMNENAANALLKLLEEPSERSIIFLLCQNMGKMLPTIKSRCRKITLHPLSQKELADQIQARYPALEDIDTVVQLSDGSLGLAQIICEHDGLGLYRKMLSFLVPIDRLSLEDMKSFIDFVCEEDVSFNLIRKFLLDWIYHQAKSYAGTAPYVAEDYIDLYQETEKLFFDIDRIYLDKKQVLQAVFLKLAEVCHD